MSSEKELKMIKVPKKGMLNLLKTTEPDNFFAIIALPGQTRCKIFQKVIYYQINTDYMIRAGVN